MPLQIVSGWGDENWPVVIRPMVFSAPVETRLTPKDSAAVRFISANFTRSMHLLFGRGRAPPQIVDDALGERSQQGGRAVGHCLAGDPAGQRQRVPHSLHLDASSGKVCRRSLRTGSRSC